MQWQMTFGVMTVKLMIEKSLPRRHKGSKKREEKKFFICSSCLSALVAIIQTMKREFGEEYASTTDAGFTAKYRASCFCNAVEYEVGFDPVDAKICHCLGCQKLHGAPMQWAAIFHKHDVRITKGIEHLQFYNSELDKHERILPCKVSCTRCGTLIADEGCNMWLAFPSLFDFGSASKVPVKFKPTCHIFYGMRIIDIADDLPKWSGHKDKSKKL